MLRLLKLDRSVNRLSKCWYSFKKTIYNVLYILYILSLIVRKLHGIYRYFLSKPLS